MNIRVRIDDGVLELVSTDDSSRLGSSIISRPHFSVKATFPGITTLYVSLNSSDVCLCINIHSDAFLFVYNSF